MFEAYAIGVTLKLHNLISPQLTVLAQEFARLDALTSTLNANLRKVGAESAGLRAVAAAGRSTSTALERAAFSAARLERRLIAVKMAAHSMPPMPPMLPGGGGHIPGMPGGGGGVPGGGGGHGGGGGGGGRGGFGQYAHGGNIHMGPGGIGVGTVGMSAGNAFVPLAIGAALAYGGHAIYEAAKELNTEQLKFKLLGLSDAQNSEAFKFVDGMHAYGTTRAENMKAFREAQGVFRESGQSDSSALAGAKIAAPVLAQLDFLAKAVGGESGAKMATANMAMLRYVELSGGLKSPEEFNRIANFGWKLNQSSGGTIDWHQLLAFKKTAGSAGYNLTDDGLARLEPIMAELSGGRAGTADRTAYNRIMGITRLPNPIAHALVDNGVWDGTKITWNANGGIKNAKGNPLSEANSKLFHESPEQFYEEVMKPIYTKMKLSTDQITRENAAIFGSTGGAFFNAIERALPLIQMSVEAVKKVKGITESKALAEKGLSGQEVEFTAAWTEFKATSGTVLLPFFSGLLKTSASIIRAITAIQAGQEGDSNWTKLGNFLSGKTTQSIYEKVLPGSTFNRPGQVGDNPAEQHGFVAGQAGGGRGFINNIHIDGRVIAEVVTKRQSAAANRPQAGTFRFDGTRALTPAGAN